MINGDNQMENKDLLRLHSPSLRTLQSTMFALILLHNFECICVINQWLKRVWNLNPTHCKAPPPGWSGASPCRVEARIGRRRSTRGVEIAMADLRLASSWLASTIWQGSDFRVTLGETKLFYKTLLLHKGSLQIPPLITHCGKGEKSNIFNNIQFSWTGI